MHGSLKGSYLLLYPRHPGTADQSAEAGHPHYPLGCRNQPEEAKGVSEEDGLGVADGVQDGMVGEGSGFRLYFSEEGGIHFMQIYSPTIQRPSSFLPDVTDGQTIEKVHENNNYQEDEGEEEEVTDVHQVALLVYWKSTELQFADKHRE